VKKVIAYSFVEDYYWNHTAVFNSLFFRAAGEEGSVVGRPFVATKVKWDLHYRHLGRPVAVSASWTAGTWSCNRGLLGFAAWVEIRVS
jgi:hypothetical protein